MSSAKIYEAHVIRGAAPFLLVVAQAPENEGYCEGTLIPPEAVTVSKPFVRIGLGTRSHDAAQIVYEAVFERARQQIVALLPEDSWLPQEIVFTPLENQERLSARLSLNQYPAWENAVSSSHISVVRDLAGQVRRIAVLEVGGN